MVNHDHGRALKFLMEFFSDEELTNLCFEYFFPVYNEFTTGMPKGQKVRLLVEACLRNGRMPDLLGALERERPNFYQDHFVTVPTAPTPTSQPTERSRHQIFVSHAHQDADFAHQLANDLEAHGYAVWIAPDSIRPGEKWVEAINRGLEESGIFVLVLTPDAVASSWVQTEANVAIGMEHRGKVRFLPLELKTVTTPPLWEGYQWISFRSEYKNGLENLLQTLQPKEMAQLHQLYRELQQAVGRNEWHKVQTLGEKILNQYPDYRETGQLIVQAKQEAKRQELLQQEAAQLYQRLHTAIAAEAWDNASRLVAQIQERVKNYRDVAKLATMVQQKRRQQRSRVQAKQEAKRQELLQQEAAQLYQRLQAAIAAKAWDEASSLVAKIQERIKDYRDVAKLATMVQQKQQQRRWLVWTQHLANWKRLPAWSWVLLLMPLTVLGLLFWAVGDGGDSDREEPTVMATTRSIGLVPAATDEPAATDTAASGAVSTLEAVQSATIQIGAQGSFVDPELGLQLNAAGRGSGFIIDESGIAVTNNHVVTGAALLQVWVGGDDNPRNARVLGVSECSDLAVIDIDGEGYPYLEWHEGDINVGLDVYAAGFPLGDPEFTLTRGIVSKAQTGGETNWASVDSVIEHDATINPGNSGGPLINSEGQVVGVNYAGASDTNQYFAIVRDEAIRVIEQLRQGQDVNSIGVNGQAVSDGESVFGIWVASVESGSPADRSGVEAGDIITALEGLVLATDGTMADYCDVLRSHSPDDTLNIEVLRYATQEVLEGQLNGRELVTTFSFAQQLQEQAAAEGIQQGNTGAYSGYRTVSDNSGILTVDVPNEWTDVDGSAWTLSGEAVGVSVSAAPDLNGFNTTWTTPGIFFGVSDSLIQEFGSMKEVLDILDFSDSCTYDGREPYSDALYTGAYDVWSACGGEDVLYVVLASTPETRDILVLVQVQVVSDADLEVLDYILNTFVVNQ